MTSCVSPKVRLVICPKCRQVLPELPQVPLYICGGCDTVLLAKKPKPETNINVSSSSQETDSIAQSRPVELCEDASVISTSPDAACPPIQVSPAETKEFVKQNPVGRFSNIYHGESSQDGSFSDELPRLDRHESDQTKQELSEQVLQEDDLFAEIQNLPEQVNRGSVLARQVNACGNQKEGHLQEMEPSQIISCANESISPKAEQIKEKNTSFTKGYRSNAASRCPSKESLVSFYLKPSENDRPDHFPRENRHNIGRFSSLDTFGSLSPPMANYPQNGSYYTYYSSESSYDGKYDQIGRPRKNKDVNTRNREAEPEWGPTRNHCPSRPGETGNYTSGNKTRLDGREGFSRLPFSSSASTGLRPACYQPGSQLDLLRTICELQDKLNRMQFPEIRRYEHFRPETEFYSGACHPRCYNVTHSRANVCPVGLLDPHRRLPRPICSCPHCHPGPQDWRYSAQQPMCGAHIKPVHVSISSPLHKAALGQKEKYFAGKRQLRPLAGGAPVVTCPSCFELLGLPGNFILFDRKKRGQMLTCGSCGAVLRFSLDGGTHIVSSVSAPTLPGEVEEREMKLGLTGAQGEDEPSMGRWRKVGPNSGIGELSSSPVLQLMG